jgi:hypothetical protein
MAHRAPMLVRGPWGGDARPRRAAPDPAAIAAAPYFRSMFQNTGKAKGTTPCRFDR